MILWSIQLLSSVGDAVAGRRHPHQLAWATAFGFWVGIVPHGNLVAATLVLIVLSLKLNHAMAALTAVATSLLIAAPLDGVAHRLGEMVLTDPQVRPLAMQFWELPLVPWTDLNNTVVLGSFLIGFAALVPMFVVVYPLFRLFAPNRGTPAVAKDGPAGPTPGSRSVHEKPPHQVVIVDRAHGRVRPSSRDLAGSPASEASELSDGAERDSTLAVETRIDVIRMKDHRSATRPETKSGPDSPEGQPMDEALNYLLRQLRDSQQRSAA